MILDLLNTIRLGGGSVVVEDGDLRLRVPAGLLTPEDKAVLVQHKADLVRLLAPVDLEREAIQWVEALPPAAGEIVVERAVEGWEEIVVSDQPAAPCKACGNPIAWLSAGRMICGLCQPAPEDAKLWLVVHENDKARWTDYHAERAEQGHLSFTTQVHDSGKIKYFPHRTFSGRSLGNERAERDPLIPPPPIRGPNFDPSSHAPAAKT